MFFGMFCESERKARPIGQSVHKMSSNKQDEKRKKEEEDEKSQ